MMEGAANFEYRFDYQDYIFQSRDSTAFTFQTSTNSNGTEIISRSDLFTLYNDLIAHLENVKPANGKFVGIHMEQHGLDLVVESSALKPKSSNSSVGPWGLSTGKNWWAVPYPKGRFGECTPADDQLGLGDAEDLLVKTLDWRAAHEVMNDPSIPKPQLPPNSQGVTIELWFSGIYRIGGFTHFDLAELYEQSTDGDCMDDQEINDDVDALTAFLKTQSNVKNGTYPACFEIEPTLLNLNDWLHLHRPYGGKPQFARSNTQHTPLPN